MRETEWFSSILSLFSLISIHVQRNMTVCSFMHCTNMDSNAVSHKHRSIVFHALNKHGFQCSLLETWQHRASCIEQTRISMQSPGDMAASCFMHWTNTDFNAVSWRHGSIVFHALNKHGFQCSLSQAWQHRASCIEQTRIPMQSLTSMAASRFMHWTNTDSNAVSHKTWQHRASCIEQTRIPMQSPGDMAASCFMHWTNTDSNAVSHKHGSIALHALNKHGFQCSLCIEQTHGSIALHALNKHGFQCSLLETWQHRVSCIEQTSNLFLK